MNASRGLILAVAGIAALGLGLGFGHLTRTSPERAPASTARTSEQTVLLPAARAITDFTLTDQDGAPFTKADFTGHWSLLFAGFTHCPDVCPTTLGVLKAVEQRAGKLPTLKVVFLSVDPERDTPEAMKKYLGYFGGTFKGISGPKEELDKLTGSLGLAYMKAPASAAGDYSVDHSASLVLIDPQGRAAAYLQPPHQVEAIVADLTSILGSAKECPGLAVKDAWIRELPPGGGMTAAYATFENTGGDALRITGVSTAAFKDASLHRTELENGQYRMVEMPVLDIAAGGSAVLAPNGAHLMLMAPTRELRAGEQVPVSFRCGMDVSEFPFTVRAATP